MGSGDSQRTLLVSPDPIDPTDLESQLSDTTVAHLPELPRVFEELTTGVYDCLVLPATVGDQAGTDLACGIATMYPELQIARGRLEQISWDQDHVDCIDESLARTEAIVDMVVDLSSKETTVEDPKPIWLSRLSREVWDTLAESGTTLDIADDSRVVADQEAASLLLQFLFQNAIEHGGPTVTVGATETGFFVADDGPGIDGGSPERVLDPGYSTVEGNTGFGLYIAKTVAEDHNWTLSVAERSGGGMRFDIENVDLGA